MRKLTIDGRLAKDAEVITSRNGEKFVKFTVANSVYANNTEETEWVDVISFSTQIIEKRIKALTKGSYVIVDGAFSDSPTVKGTKMYKNWTIKIDDNGLTIPMLGKRTENEVPSENTAYAEESRAYTETVSTVVEPAYATQSNEDSLPF